MFARSLFTARKPSSAGKAFPPVVSFKQTAMSMRQLHDKDYSTQYLEATLLCFLAVDMLAISHPGSVTIENNVESVYALIDSLMQTNTQEDEYYQALHQSIRTLSPGLLLDCIADTQRIYSSLSER